MSEVLDIVLLLCLGTIACYCVPTGLPHRNTRRHGMMIGGKHTSAPGAVCRRATACAGAICVMIRLCDDMAVVHQKDHPTAYS